MKYKVLSAAFVRTVTKPGRYGDGNGLYLLVTPTGGALLECSIRSTIRSMAL